MAGNQFGAHLSVAMRVVIGGGDLGLHRSRSPPDRRQVDGGLDRADADSVCVAHGVCDFGTRDQSLGRYAAGPQGVAANTCLLDDGNAQAEAGRELGGGEACGAHADDDEVVAHNGRVAHWCAR